MERELIAALIADPRQVDHVSAIVRDRDFLDPQMKAVYRVLLVMRENRVPTDDLALLIRHLKQTGITAQEIGRLVGSGVAANAMHYAKEVSEGARRLRLSEGLGIAYREALAEGSDLNQVILDAEAVIEAERATSDRAAVHVTTAGKELVKRLREPSESAVCFSGIYSLDEKIGGFLAGEMVIIAARPGEGKTSLAMQLAMHNARKGRPGLFCSLEMERTELAGRVFCGMSDVDSNRLRKREITEADVQRIEKAITETTEAGCWIWDPPKATIDEIASAAKLEATRHRIGWVVVDYIGLIDAGNRRGDRREHIGHFSRSLKRLAKELKVPVFVLAQLNREACKGEPQLHHLKESGDIEQDADTVIFIHQPEEHKHEILIPKNRHGESRIALDVTFDGRRTSFSDPNAVSVGRSSDVYGDVGLAVSDGGRWFV
jgi:replicative DNA helicase